MSRHRNVRTMNYDDDYEGYDDVYGHSMEDDYGVSPSASQYMYDRSKPQQVAYFTPEEDIAEEPEEDGEGDTKKVRERLDSLTIDSAVADLLPEEETLLKTCLEEIHNIVGDSIPDSVIISSILRNQFNTEKALDECLRGHAQPLQEEPKQSKGVRREREPSKEPTKPGTDTTISDMTPPPGDPKPPLKPVDGIPPQKPADKLEVSLLDSLAASHLEKVQKTSADSSQPSATNLNNGSKPFGNSLFALKQSNLLGKPIGAKSIPNPLFKPKEKQDDVISISETRTDTQQPTLQNATVKNFLFRNARSATSDMADAKAEAPPVQPAAAASKNLLFHKPPSSRNVLFSHLKNFEQILPPGSVPVDREAPPTDPVKNNELAASTKLGQKTVGSENESPVSKAAPVIKLRKKKTPLKKIQCYEVPEIFMAVEPRLSKQEPSLLGSRIAVPCDGSKKARFFRHSDAWDTLTSVCAERCFKFDTPSPDEQIRLAQIFNRPALGYQQPAVNTSSSTPKARPKQISYDCSHHDC